MGSVAGPDVSGQFVRVETSAELEELAQKLSDDHWKACSATYELIQGGIDSIRLTGDLDDPVEIPRIEVGADLQSLSLQSDDGDLLRYSVSNQSTQSTVPVDYPRSQIALFIGTVFAYSIREVDQFIERNGLRPVVDEGKKRQWVVTVATVILTACYQL